MANDPKSEPLPVNVAELARAVVKRISLSSDYIINADLGCSEHCVLVQFSDYDLATELSLLIDTDSDLSDAWLCMSDSDNLTAMYLHYRYPHS